MGIEKIVNAIEYYDQDLVRRGDILVSEYDLGVGRLFTGAVHSTYLTAAGVASGVMSSSFYNTIAENISAYSDLLYQPVFIWSALAAGIGFGLAETNKQKVVPGAAVVGLVVYSVAKTTSALGVPAYYLITGAAIKSGLTLSAIGSAVMPVAAVFGIGWTLAYLYKNHVKRRKAKKKKK